CFKARFVFRHFSGRLSLASFALQSIGSFSQCLLFQPERLFGSFKSVRSWNHRSYAAETRSTTFKRIEIFGKNLALGSGFFSSYLRLRFMCFSNMRRLSFSG